jgi:hypothetical protein
MGDHGCQVWLQPIHVHTSAQKCCTSLEPLMLLGVTHWQKMMQARAGALIKSPYSSGMMKRDQQVGRCQCLHSITRDKADRQVRQHAERALQWATGQRFCTSKPRNWDAQGQHSGNG